ncbi:hypothetical protein HDU96_006920 [Phlyctochytrium bullatum]|nr:hypothetical protein HDU96_006920 [Phlyctochytrium bullatum]
MKTSSIISTLAVALAASADLAVAGGAGSKPAALGKIQNVVLLVLENRSFDNMLGWWARTRTGVDGFPDKACNVLKATNTTICANDRAIYINKDPNHETIEVTEEHYGLGVDTLTAAEKGLFPDMSGFIDVNAKTWNTTDPAIVRQAIDGYNPKNVPITVALAQEFAVFDRWFCSMPGPTYPNRLFLYSATAAGETVNRLFEIVKGFPQKSIFGAMEDNKLTWKNYFGLIPTSIFMQDTRQLGDLASKLKPMSEFYEDARNGKLPNLSLIDPILFQVPGFQANDNHPPHNVARGEALVKNMYEALRRSPQWNTTAFIITYDENGGFYDHVPPPYRGVPSPDAASSASPVFRFDRLGARVPTLVISPWVRKGRVVNRPANPPAPTSEFEHSSIAATLRKLFAWKGAPLTAREAWAGSFEYLFEEVGSQPRTDAPWTLPDAPALDQDLAPEETEDDDSVEEYGALKDVYESLRIPQKLRRSPDGHATGVLKMASTNGLTPNSVARPPGSSPALGARAMPPRPGASNPTSPAVRPAGTSAKPSPKPAPARPGAPSGRPPNTLPARPGTSAKPTTPTLPPKEPEQYSEYVLYSSGPGLPCHLMKVNVPKFNFSTMVPPLRMIRKVPEPDPAAAAAAAAAAGEEGKDGAGQKKKKELFKKRVRPMFFGAPEEDDGIPVAARMGRKKDPDRFPWALSDFHGEELEGNLEGSQKANYALFIVRAEEAEFEGGKADSGAPLDGFKVKPVSKWYKFSRKPKHTILTAEEAEARMANTKKSEERWFMRAMKKEEDPDEGLEGLKKEEADEVKKMLKRKQFKVVSDSQSSKRRNFNRDGIEEELDYDEVMSDDENPDFGIENEEEAKEAKKREFGDLVKKAKFEDDGALDEVDQRRKKRADAGTKSLKKALKRNERDSVYISDDDQENPYDSNAEATDDDEPDEIVEVIGKEDVGNAGAAAGGASTSAPSSKVGSPSLANATKAKKPTPSPKPGTQPPVDRNLLQVKKEAARSGPGSPSELAGTPPTAASQGSGKSPKPGKPTAGRSPALAAGTAGRSPRPVAGGSGTPRLGGAPSAASGTGTPNITVSSASSTVSTTIKVKLGGGKTPDVSRKAPGASPDLERKRKVEEEAPPSNEPKKIKLKLGGGSSPEIPPPPSTEEIFRKQREDELQRRQAAKMAAAAAGSGRSPTPNIRPAGASSSIGRSPAVGSGANGKASPSVSSRTGTPNVAGDDSNLLQDDDLIQALSGPNPPQTVKEIVAVLRNKISRDPRNKDLLKDMIKRLCHMVNGVFKLNPAAS